MRIAVNCVILVVGVICQKRRVPIYDPIDILRPQSGLGTAALSAEYEKGADRA